MQRAFGKDCDENHMKEDMGVVDERAHEFVVFRQKVLARIIRFD